MTTWPSRRLKWRAALTANRQVNSNNADANYANNDDGATDANSDDDAMDANSDDDAIDANSHDKSLPFRRRWYVRL